MGQVKERVCMKHKNEIDGNLILRYESTVNECPLCKALEAAPTTDADVQAIKEENQALTDAVAKAEDVAKANEETIATLNKEAEEAKEAINLLEQERDDIQSTAEEIESTCGELEGTIEELKGKIDALQAEMDAMPVPVEPIEDEPTEPADGGDTDPVDTEDDDGDN